MRASSGAWWHRHSANWASSSTEATATWASASWNCTAWNDDSGLPNWTRSTTWAVARSTAARSAPATTKLVSDEVQRDLRGGGRHRLAQGETAHEGSRGGCPAVHRRRYLAGPTRRCRPRATRPNTSPWSTAVASAGDPRLRRDGEVPDDERARTGYGSTTRPASRHSAAAASADPGSARASMSASAEPFEQGERPRRPRNDGSASARRARSTPPPRRRPCPPPRRSRARQRSGGGSPPTTAGGADEGPGHDDPLDLDGAGRDRGGLRVAPVVLDGAGQRCARRRPRRCGPRGPGRGARPRTGRTARWRCGPRWRWHRSARPAPAPRRCGTPAAAPPAPAPGRAPTPTGSPAAGPRSRPRHQPPATAAARSAA